jgi:D-alanine-D-alanine ligase
VLSGVVAAVESLGLQCVHVETPAELAAAAPRLRGSVVLSTYAGEGSRSRLALVPAVAESLGLDFVGLDAMGQALAHDKEVMKRIATDCGLLTPRSRLIRDLAAANICNEFPAPYVLKPVSEGSSIGISQRNIIWNGRKGPELARELISRFRQPVLLEAFVPGREVSLISIEDEPSPHRCFVEVVVEGKSDYFSRHLFDADEKLNRRLPRKIVRIDADLRADDRVAIGTLLDAIGHYEVIRVDGKLTDDGRFHFLELTPDPWLGIKGHIAQGFIVEGWSYPDVIRAILASARLARRGRPANG